MVWSDKDHDNDDDDDNHNDDDDDDDEFEATEHTLANGQIVFKTEDGTLYDEDGNELGTLDTSDNTINPL